MKSSSQYKVAVYTIIVLLSLSKSKKLSKYIPKQIKDFAEEYYYEILVVCYGFLVYYYSNVEYE
jgi:hypothetical protein